MLGQRVICIIIGIKSKLKLSFSPRILIIQKTFAGNYIHSMKKKKTIGIMPRFF